jgi:hypothetical protein
VALAFGSLFTILETRLGSTLAIRATSRIVALAGFVLAESLFDAILPPNLLYISPFTALL